MDIRMILIRHGETDWNRQRRIQGHVDIPLNETGLLQAERVGERMRLEAIDSFFSSDLQRAKRTAEIIAKYHCMDVQIDTRLRERNYGELEGLTKEQIDLRFPDYQSRDHAVQGQETLEEVRVRAMDALTDIARRQKSGTVAVVSHGGWINAVLYVVSNGCAGTGITHLKNTSISTLLYNGHDWRIESIGDASHLHPVLF
jgi:2,3-bisphosphoglycerate-dependent phosphoglycerate mutase